MEDYSVVVDNSERFVSYAKSFENILKELSEQRIQIQSSIENLDIF
ncbi:hypothetical protein J0E88_08735 [Campylobacter coli]